jgi:CRP-like cAMP-binding protein
VAVLRKQPRLATVVAASPVLKLARLDADAFNRLMSDSVRRELEEHAGSYSAAPKADA